LLKVQNVILKVGS